MPTEVISQHNSQAVSVHTGGAIPTSEHSFHHGVSRLNLVYLVFSNGPTLVLQSNIQYDYYNEGHYIYTYNNTYNVVYLVQFPTEKEKERECLVTVIS